MTHRERLLRVFRREPIDRMPVRIWGVDPMFPRQGWEPLYELVEKYDLEIIRSWSPSPEETPPLPYSAERREKNSEKEGMKEIETIVHAPAGPLVSVSLEPVDGGPGMMIKHPVESVEDAEKYLSIPSGENLPGVGSYRDLEEKTGGRALLMVVIGEAMYSAHNQLGSKLFGYWLYDERELLHRMVEKSFRELECLLKHYLAEGIGDVFGWVGPELCVPPLASVKDFREFVLDYDKKLIDMIHDCGKHVWIHCHGDMAPVLEGFIEMGCDCLNPIEPPPVGQITLSRAKDVCGGKMSLEGGVEDGSFDILSPDEMAELTEEVISEGKPGGCFILCPTSSPNTHAKLLPRHLENYRVFAETAARLRLY